jgi:hypothetical protein
MGIFRLNQILLKRQRQRGNATRKRRSRQATQATNTLRITNQDIFPVCKRVINLRANEMTEVTYMR